MLEAMAKALPTAAKVTDQLLEQYGPDKLWLIERLSEHLFRGRTTDGGVILVTVLEDGTLSIREPEVS